MNLIWTLLIGIVIGVVAKLLTPGRDPGGCVITMILGVAGSLVATYGGRALGLYREGQTAGFLLSVAGAVILLLIYRMVAGKKA